MDAENASGKIQHPFMMTNSKKVGVEGSRSNTIKARFEKPTANGRSSGEQLKAFAPKSGSEQASALTASAPHGTAGPGRGDQMGKERKGIQNGTEGATLSLGADDITLYMENVKTPPKNLPELINDDGKVAGYQTTYRNPFCLYHQHQMLREMKKTILFTSNCIKIYKMPMNKFNQSERCLL